MLELIRRQQSWLMIIVAILVIVAFAWLYDPNRGAISNPDVAMSLFGRDYRHGEVKTVARGYEAAQFLGLNQMMAVLSQADQRFAQAGDGASSDFVINTLVLREKAPKYGISVSNEEISERIKTLPILQNNGQFDPERFKVLTPLLESRGIGMTELYATVGDSILVEKSMSLVGAGIRPSSTEAAKNYELLFSSIEGTAFSLNRSDYSEGIEVSDEEIAAYYELNKGALLTEETRRIDYVYFAEPEALDQLPTEERLEKLKEYNRKVQAYSTAVVAQDADFDAITKEMGYTTTASPLFSRMKPIEAFTGQTQLVNAIFDPRRNLEDPVSDPIMVEGGAYIFRLAEIVLPEPQTLENAREQVVETVRNNKIDEALVAAADKARDAVVAAVAAGGDVAEAAKAAGASMRDVPAFQLSTPPADESPEARIIPSLASELQAGGVSPRVPTPDGALFFYCKSKTLSEDPDKQTKLSTITDRLGDRDNSLAFNAWFQKLKDEAGLKH